MLVPYSDPLEGAKQTLLDRINRDRHERGLPPFRPEPRAAMVGDRFCAEMLEGRFVSHLDKAGRAPYLRWTLAGGIDYHGENISAYRAGRTTLDRPLVDVLLDMHASMLTDAAADTHRRNLLSEDFTHIGIGVAAAGGQVRLCEEFTTVAFEWATVPVGPLARGTSATIRALPLPGWDVTGVEVAYEPPPAPLEAPSAGGYSYPPTISRFGPERLGRAGFPSPVGDQTFQVSASGRVAVSVALRAGPGHYYVIHHVRARGTRRTLPATVVRIDAR